MPNTTRTSARTTAAFNPYATHIHDDEDDSRDDDMTTNTSYQGEYEPTRHTNRQEPGTPESKSGFSLMDTTQSFFKRMSSPMSRASRRSQWDDYDSGEEWEDDEGDDDDEREAPTPSPPRSSARARASLVRSVRPSKRSSANQVRSVRPSKRSSSAVEEPTVPATSMIASSSPGAFIDPWESPEQPKVQRSLRHRQGDALHVVPQNDEDADADETQQLSPRNGDTNNVSNATFFEPSDIHPNMISREEDIAQLRLLAGRLSADWKGQDFMAPALARRIRDFQFAQEKRRRKYGNERPWGILGLYDHLASIRIDVEWAEDAAWRRANGEPYLSWADFDASKKKGINRPFFTYFLLFVCTAALIASFAVNGWTVEPLDVNPMIGPSAETLIRMGAKDSYLIVVENEAWRLVSSIILHAGLVHYFINMLALWFVGSAIETCHGPIAAAIQFIIPAVGGTVLSAIFLPEYITVGASGGIFGYIGACLADIVMNWKLLFCDFVTENGKKHHHVMVIVILVIDIALNCIIGLTPYVDNFTRKYLGLYSGVC
jgi:membrane associated rhomboid family serine protease